MQPTNKIRFENFSDGVFAIAMTLLALELRVPGLHIHNYDLSQFAPLVPQMLTFILSFVTIAIFWVNHHQLTQNLASITHRRILWLNIFFLLFVVLAPFVTQTVSLNAPSAPAISIYALVLFGASVSFSLLRYWIHKCDGDLTIHMNRSLTGPLIYFLAIFAPIIWIPLGYILLAIPPLYYFLPKASQRSF
jgi:uncharacterized membrane protein